MKFLAKIQTHQGRISQPKEIVRRSKCPLTSIDKLSQWRHLRSKNKFNWRVCPWLKTEGHFSMANTK